MLNGFGLETVVSQYYGFWKMQYPKFQTEAKVAKGNEDSCFSASMLNVESEITCSLLDSLILCRVVGDHADFWGSIRATLLEVWRNQSGIQHGCFQIYSCFQYLLLVECYSKRT